MTRRDIAARGALSGQISLSLDLYSEQDAETKVIVPALRELGYDESDPTKRVVLKFQHSITVHQGRAQKPIQADIVVFVNDSPVIVIDSKNPREYLTDNDREQVISYARLIGDIAPYAVLSNGYTWQVFDSVSKQRIKSVPTYGDLIGDLQRRRLTVRQRENLVSQATRPEGQVPKGIHRACGRGPGAGSVSVGEWELLRPGGIAGPRAPRGDCSPSRQLLFAAAPASSSPITLGRRG